MKIACVLRTYLNRAYLALGFYQLIMCSKDTYLTNYLFTHKFGVCTDENDVQIYKTAISFDLWKRTHLGVLYWAPKHAVIRGLDARSNTSSHIKLASAPITVTMISSWSILCPSVLYSHSLAVKFPSEAKFALLFPPFFFFELDPHISLKLKNCQCLFLCLTVVHGTSYTSWEIQWIHWLLAQCLRDW